MEYYNTIIYNSRPPSPDAYINSNPDSQVKGIAARNGINNEEFTANIHKEEEQLKSKFEKVTGKNDEQYNNVRKASELEKRDLQAQVNKYEQDRIGQGWFSQGTAEILDVVTFGKAGKTTGGPAKGSQKGNQLNKGAYQNAKQIKPKDE